MARSQEYKELVKSLTQKPLDDRARKVLSDAIEQVRWVQKTLQAPAGSVFQRYSIHRIRELPGDARVGCQGVPGAYSHIACEKLFGEPRIDFYEEFADVAQAVLGGHIDFGVLPVENSSAGQVSEVLELIGQQGLYINRTVDIKAEHCLCIHPFTDPGAIQSALSHPQALMQCRHFLQRHRLKPERYSNTAAAAKKVAEGPWPIACICSERSAQMYGLKILQRGIQDFDENYTRFLCVSAKNILLPGADTISIALTLPHEPGGLNRLLTRFAACNLDLSRLLSMPVASRDFSVLFYLDFGGSIEDAQVDTLLSAMHDEFEVFNFLGNYSRLL